MSSWRDKLQGIKKVGKKIQHKLTRSRERVQDNRQLLEDLEDQRQAKKERVEKLERVIKLERNDKHPNQTIIITAQHKIADLQPEISDLHDRIQEVAERKQELIKLVEELVKRKRRNAKHEAQIKAAHQNKIVMEPGPPHWDGSQDILEHEVKPVADKFGVPVTSRKRSASDPLSISNPGSDHNKANKTAGAMDLGTFNGAPLAHAIAKKLGITGYSTGNYTSYYITRAGELYRVQILWAVAGHFNHVHVGIRKV